jgi:hypothetical protein
MSPSDGYTDEMPSPILDDRALDALLRGTPSPQSGLDWLVPFVEDLGQASSEPAPVVHPALARLLADGFSISGGDQPVVPAVPAPTPSRARFVRRLAGLGLAAKVALGVGVAAASTTAAGAAGVLPAPAQHAVASVVDATTPFAFPDRASDKAVTGATVRGDATGASDGVAGVDGKAVSDAARNKGQGTAGSGGANSGTGSSGNAGTTGSDNSGSGSGNAGSGNGVGSSSTGATGLDRANETPAAGNVPTSVPGRGNGGSAGSGSSGQGEQGSNGEGPPVTTPAAGKSSTTVSAPGTGRGTSGSSNSGPSRP